ncbi:uncharacterized protein LOC108868999 [Brassica rapa]|nr:uncharacterized protein LOC108868999 [Brassica rapa]
MVKKKTKSIPLAVIGVAANGSLLPSTISASTASSMSSGSTLVGSSVSTGSLLPLMVAPPTSPSTVLPSVSEPALLSGASGSALLGSTASEAVVAPGKNYASLLKSSTQLQVVGSPSEHVSGVSFVLIPDENIEAAKLEFKDFIYARFHGDYPSMGKIIGVVNAVWARSGPRIFVHNIGQGMYLLRVTNPNTREVLISRTCWNIGGLPMFVAPWSPDYSPEELPLTSAIVPVEMRNVPYLLFNKESLSRIATAIGKPESLAPETERKENFAVAKLYVKVDLTAPLPQRIISGFSNGKEVQIEVSYPWLPVNCDSCKRFGHKTDKCTFGAKEGSVGHQSVRKFIEEPFRRRSKSRPGRSRDNMVKKKSVPCYVPVVREISKVPSVEALDIQIETFGSDATSDPNQANAPTVLEEGEIYQELSAEVAAVPEAIVVSNRFASLARLDQASDGDQHESGDDQVVEYGKNVIADELAAVSPEVGTGLVSDPAVDVLILHETSVLSEIETLIEADVPSSDPLVISVPSDIVLPSGVTAEDTTITTLLADQGSHSRDQIEDRDKSFFLPKNRKSGRKTTKHN